MGVLIGWLRSFHNFWLWQSVLCVQEVIVPSCDGVRNTSQEVPEMGPTYFGSGQVDRPRLQICWTLSR
eukprot:1122074-Amphidinium_carterae.1